LTIWLTHRLNDGTEYRLIYPFTAAGQLLTNLVYATRSASGCRVELMPQELASGSDADAIAVKDVKIGLSPNNAGAMVHVTTADDVPIAIEIPANLLKDAAQKLQQAAEALEVQPAPGSCLH
jgi:hypothetical protein